MSGRNLVNRRAALGTMVALITPAAWSRAGVPPEVQGELPGARLQGSGRLRFLGLAVYDIRLWAAAPVPAAEVAKLPLALEIEYARALAGAKIAERTLHEMRRQGAIPAESAERWLAQMTSIFPDVKAGDRLTGKQRPGEATRFFFNGSPRGEVRDAEFTRLFFGIWLAPSTSEPALRAALLTPARAPS